MVGLPFVIECLIDVTNVFFLRLNMSIIRFAVAEVIFAI